MVSCEGTYDTPASKIITLEKVIEILQSFGAEKFYVKKLSPNDNSKNQPYFGSHLTDISFIPTGNIVTSETTSNKSKAKKNDKSKIKYQASMKLIWVDAKAHPYPAPHAKLIYYPQYPEVRFSGFLRGSNVNISKWMSPEKKGRSVGRWLIFGVSKDETVYSYLVTPECNLANELESTKFIEISQIIWQLDIKNSVPEKSTRTALIQKLYEIHNMGWIPGQKLNAAMEVTPYKAQNGGGYTLEAMLGIPPNGVAEPDYLGWEVKQFGVTKLPCTGAKPTTLMTPEPDGGFYTTAGVIEFIKTYGYADTSGIPDRFNFGGKHSVGKTQERTGLEMHIIGFDPENSEITDADGEIALLDNDGNITASWSFSKLMDHWKRKHSQAVYVPCLRRSESGIYKYFYGKNIELGTDTNFEMFLSALFLGTVFYDPGIKLENASSKTPKTKRRSQFRVNHKHLNTLYKNFEHIIAEP